ncbi:MAG: secondary thiamine-phosphate synthase enzyme YjbQ [Salinirussus sp.]
MDTARFTVETDERLTCVDVTDRVTSALPRGTNGAVTVFAEHTTCGVLINEAEDRLLNDFEMFLDGVVADSGWDHDDLDDNADSHLRAALIGPDVTVPVHDGELELGTWQAILLVECDGPRRRTVSVST